MEKSERNDEDVLAGLAGMKNKPLKTAPIAKNRSTALNKSGNGGSGNGGSGSGCHGNPRGLGHIDC